MTISGGVGIVRQIKAARRADVLIAVPGRLLELLRRRLLRLNGVAVCILDQADRMLDMGFLPCERGPLSVARATPDDAVRQNIRRRDRPPGLPVHDQSRPS